MTHAGGVLFLHSDLREVGVSVGVTIGAIYMHKT